MSAVAAAQPPSARQRFTRPKPNAGSRPAGPRSSTPASFETDDDRYCWLNDVIAVGEGVIDFETLRLRLRYYGCVEEVSSHPGEWA